MSTTIKGVVTNGVVVPNSPLPEGANVEVVVVLPEKPTPGPCGVPADQVRGIAARVTRSALARRGDRHPVPPGGGRLAPRLLS